MSDKKTKELRLMTVFEDFNHEAPTYKLPMENIARALEMIYEIERLNEELRNIDIEATQKVEKYELN